MFAYVLILCILKQKVLIKLDFKFFLKKIILKSLFYTAHLWNLKGNLICIWS